MALYLHTSMRLHGVVLSLEHRDNFTIILYFFERIGSSNVALYNIRNKMSVSIFATRTERKHRLEI